MTHTTKSSTLTDLSVVLGWICFFAWSISFYFQIHLNWKRKSVRGMSFDYQLYNFVGFLGYSIFNIVTYINEHKNSSDDRTVEPNDIAFALHAFFATCINVGQIFIYDREGQNLSRFAFTVTLVLVAIAIYNCFLSGFGELPWFKYEGYSSIQYLGYVKSAVTLIKYTPQAFMNFKHKTTKGFSIGNILLDFTGGTFSLAQQIVDSDNQSDWSVMFGNVPKLILSLESIVFDTLFMVQHYILYGDEKDRPVEDEYHRFPTEDINGDVDGQCRKKGFFTPVLFKRGCK